MSNETAANIIKIPIHPSIIEPVMIAGAEREPVIMLGCMSVMVWMAGKDFVSLCLSLAIWFIGIFAARLMAKIDAQLIRTFIRHLRYQDYYPAAENINAR